MVRKRFTAEQIVDILREAERAPTTNEVRAPRLGWVFRGGYR